MPLPTLQESIAKGKNAACRRVAWSLSSNGVEPWANSEKMQIASSVFVTINRRRRRFVGPSGLPGRPRGHFNGIDRLWTGQKHVNGLRGIPSSNNGNDQRRDDDH